MNRLTRLVVTGATISAAWGVVLAYVAYNALPHNPLSLPYARELSDLLTTATPQGWRFFTRDPREPKTRLLTKAGERWEAASLGPTSRPSHAFGFDRRARAQGMEHAWIMAHARPADWSECEEEITRCLDEGEAVATVMNRVPHPTLCGRIGIVRQQPVPWAWRDSGAALHMPAQTIVLDIDCEPGALP